MLNGDQDWINQALRWVTDSGLGSIATAAIAAAVRWGLQFDRTPRDVVASFVLALFVIAFFAPAVAEWLELGPRAAAGAGAGLALIARPFVVTLLLAGKHLRDNPDRLIPLRWRK